MSSTPIKIVYIWVNSILQIAVEIFLRRRGNMLGMKAARGQIDDDKSKKFGT